MHKVNPQLVFLSQKSLERAADKKVLDDYLTQKAREKYEDHKANLGFDHVVEILREEVERLPEIKREIIHLKFWEDQSDLKISQKLKMTVRQVQSLLKATLKTLRENILRALSQSYRFKSGEVLCFIDA